MSGVAMCTCGHASQIHTAPLSPKCRGKCWRSSPQHAHTLADHDGPCTAGRCICDRYSPKNRSAA